METPPRLTRAELSLLDRLASEEYGLPIAVLMENAGRGAAEEILAGMRERDDKGGVVGRVVVLAGSGNNGGDACVVARHLSNAGVVVEVFFAGEPHAFADADLDAAARMRRVVERMGIAVEGGLARLEASLGQASVVVDGLLGTGFRGEVRPEIARWIDAVNHSARERGTTVVALDLPSGLDADSGRPSSSTIVADVTVTFAARKIGFDAPEAAPYVGQVVVAPIGVPTELLRRVRGTG
ncbi:MAG: NAD(P)H-hydrate epimerase [Planctomycetota bacterium]